MNRIKYFLVGLNLIFLNSCSKQLTTEGYLNKNCTGDYIKINSKEYLICNYKMIENIANGSKINFNYKLVNQCSENDNRVHCLMLYEHDGFIEIKKIK